MAWLGVVGCGGTGRRGPRVRGRDTVRAMAKLTSSLVFRRVRTPLGVVLLGARIDDEGERLCLLGFDDGRAGPEAGDLERLAGARWAEGEAGVLEAAEAQLEAYFAGELRAFELSLWTPGTAFERAVWAELGNIGFGETISYASLAARVGRPGAARAVGGANGRNRIAIVVPCHRVINADGGLGGYAGGLDRKARLLELERAGRGTLFEPVAGSGAGG